MARIHVPMIFDDTNSVVHNPSVARLWPLVGDAELPGPLNPQQDFCTAGRPLVNLSLALNFHFGRYNPVGYHLFSMAVHLLSALLLWAIVSGTLRLDFFQRRYDGAADILAFLVALLWAVHPLQTEAVQYITQRTELLMALFYLATVYGSIRYWEAKSSRGRTTWLLLSTAACLAGMACKEVMVSAPVIVLLYERTFVAGSFRGALRASWPLYVALALCWSLLLALNVGGPRAESAGFGHDIAAHVWWFTQAKALLMYLKLSLWPRPLVIHYELSRPETIAAAWPYVLPVVMLGATTVWLFLRRTAAGFALVWMFAILSPTLVVPIITENAAERRMYLPLAALIAIAVVGGFEFASRGFQPAASRCALSWDRKPLLAVVMAGLVLAVAAGTASARRVELYNEPLRLWQDAFVHQPDSPLVRLNLGLTLMAGGLAEEALPQLREGVRLRPEDGGTYNNLGFCLIKVGRPEEAIQQIARAIELSHESVEAENNMGLALVAAGRTEEAVGHFRQALEYKPAYADAQVNLGVVLARLGQFDEAIEHLNHALRIDPEHPDAFAPLLNAYMELGQSKDAIATAERGSRWRALSAGSTMPAPMKYGCSSRRGGQARP